MYAQMPYTNRHVRDLAWACFSPPLMIVNELADDGDNVANCGLALTPAREERLRALDEDPRPLQRHLGDTLPSRLGLYFEKLWQFFLADDPAVDLLAHNLPVRDGGQTLGEFDCLYYCHHRRRTFHLELAVKYYLHWPGARVSPEAAWSDWIGPNAADRLDLKLRRLLDHQCRLSQRPEGQQTLRDNGIDSPVAEAEIKGWLFSSADQNPLPPHGYNPQRPMGTWIRHSQLAAYLEQATGSQWQLLPRLEWLAPANPSTPALQGEALADALDRHFAHHQQPVQLAQLLRGRSGTLTEVSRTFVVSERWPGSTAGSYRR
jgi:hypothetical protein